MYKMVWFLEVYMSEVKEKKKMKLWKKILLISGVTILSIGVIGVVGIFSLWGNEISSVCSIRKLVETKEDNKSGPVYEMTIHGGYYFDKFIDQGGVSSDNELIDFIVDNISKGILPISISAPTIGCASFTAINENGERIMGRNYDFSTTASMIVKTDPGDGRYKSISSVDLQFLGIDEEPYADSLASKFLSLAVPYIPLDGINEKGVACSILMSYQGDGDETVPTNQQTEKPDLTSTTMLRMILDYAGSVDEAIKMVSKYDLHDSANTSFHYMIADSTGDSAILEWFSNEVNSDTDGSKRILNVIRNDDDAALGEKEGADDFQYVTNFLVTPDYYNNDEEKGGFDRYNKIQEMINPDGTNTEGKITNDYALDILETVGRRKWDKANGDSDSNGITVYSTLFNLTNKEMIFVSNEEFDNPASIFTYKL